MHVYVASSSDIKSIKIIMNTIDAILKDLLSFSASNVNADSEVIVNNA
jgi:hypothetical protein